MSWVATATGVCVAAIYYVMNLRISQRNQILSLKTQELALKSQEQNLETRQAQLFMQIYGKVYEPNWITDMNRVIATNYKDFDDYQRIVRENPDELQKWTTVAMYFEGLGVLVKRGMISPGMVDDLLSGWVLSYWEKFKPYVYELRRRYNYPAAGEWAEYLYNEVKRIANEQHGEMGPISEDAFKTQASPQ